LSLVHASSPSSSLFHAESLVSPIPLTGALRATDAAAAVEAACAGNRDKGGQGLVFAAIGADTEGRLRFHAPASPDPAVCEQYLRGATVEACVAERIGCHAKRTRKSLDGQEPHGAPMTLDADYRLARNACSRGKLGLTQACGKPVRTQSRQLGRRASGSPRRRVSERRSRRLPTAFRRSRAASTRSAAPRLAANFRSSVLVNQEAHCRVLPNTRAT